MAEQIWFITETDLPDGSADRKMVMGWLNQLHDVIEEAPDFSEMVQYTTDQIWLREMAMRYSKKLKALYYTLNIDGLIVEMEE